MAARRQHSGAPVKKDLRERVFDRDRYCVKCGKVLQDPVAVHHRKLKKQGGRDELANLVALCSPCHNIAPGSVHQNPEHAYRHGYMVPSWADPEEWPLLLPNGDRVLLLNDGTMITLERGEDGW